MENYYQILDVDSKASNKEIKIAYKKQLRKHPPEKDPDGFEKIRNAYDVLNNEKSRAEYDAMLNHKDEIEEYRENALKAMEENNYKKAIKYFKKILVIEPSLANIRNLLGLSYLNNKDLKNALNQFTRIVKENSDNASYLFNLAMTYKAKGHPDKAEKYLKKSYEIDNINPDTVLELSHIYYDQGNADKAINLLNEAIKADGVVDFQDFIFFFSIVELHIASGNINEAEKVLNQIEDILPEDPDSRSYVGWKFGKLAVTLFDLKAYDLAEKVSGWALKFDPDNQDLSSIKSTSGDFKRLFSSYLKLEKDDQVIEPLKGPFYFYLYSNDGSVSDSEWKKYQKEVFQAIDSYIKNQPDAVVNSISRIKRRYYELFKISEEITKLYKDILKDAREQKEFFDQIQDFQNDSNIIDEFKGFLSLWLSQEYTERERERYSNNIFDKLDYYIQMEKESKIISSIRRIKIKYQKIYQLNDKFFDNIQQEVKKIKREKSNSSSSYNSNSSSYNSASTNYSSSNNSSNNSYNSNNKSYNGSNNSNKSNDSDDGSGCGCLLLAIIAIIFSL
ncbi:MAG: J domain-containing protein [Bacillota bacterium]